MYMICMIIVVFGLDIVFINIIVNYGIKVFWKGKYCWNYLIVVCYMYVMC